MCEVETFITLFQGSRRREGSAGSLHDASTDQRESGPDADRVRTCLIHTIQTTPHPTHGQMDLEVSVFAGFGDNHILGLE